MKRPARTHPAGRALMLGLLHAAVVGAGPHETIMGGPWEIWARMGLEGDVLHFPVPVADENRAQDLSLTLPVRGTDLRLEVTHFLPDLGWTTTCVADPNGGSAARVHLSGPQLAQTLWLDSRTLGRQSISAPVGGLLLREVQDPNTLVALQEPGAVGLLTLRAPAVSGPSVELAVWPGLRHTLADGHTTLTVLRYEPHYRLDRDSQTVHSASQEPVNPALQVRIETGGQTYERWIWERFTAPPHATHDFEWTLRFRHTWPGTRPGRHVLVTCPRGPTVVLARAGQRLAGGPLEPERAYPFGDSDYRFTVTTLRHGVRLATTWRNQSARLVRPALVGTVHTGDVSRETVLPFNRPTHVKTEAGTLVLLYRRRVDVNDR